MNYEYEASGVIHVSSSIIIKIKGFVLLSSPPIKVEDRMDTPEAFFYRLLERGEVNKISHPTPIQKVGVFLYEEDLWQ